MRPYETVDLMALYDNEAIICIQALSRLYMSLKISGHNFDAAVVNSAIEIVRREWSEKHKNINISTSDS